MNIEKIITNKSKPMDKPNKPKANSNSMDKPNNISKIYSNTLTENNIIQNITNNMILELIKKK